MDSQNNTTSEEHFISVDDAAGESIDVVLNGGLTIGQAAELRVELEKILEMGKGVTLHGDSIDKIDTAAVQVITAFVRDATQRSIKVTWSEVSGHLMQVVEILGLTKELGLDAQLADPVAG